MQFGADWGTNFDGSGRRDLWSATYNTAPQNNKICIHGGVVVGTQPRNATWSETKRDGGGYAITFNGKNAIVERMRVDNHHDGFVPYRSDGFVYRDNWQSHSRDDCIENDGRAAGTIHNNLFDGCYVFYSATGGDVVAAGKDGTVHFTDNLVNMYNMTGPYEGSSGPPLGDPSKSGYGEFIKTRGADPEVPKFVFRNNVFAFGPRNNGAVQFLNAAHVNITECSNNTVLWLGSGSFPAAGTIPAAHKGCFKIVTGDAAKQQWSTLRQKWIDAHPDIPRL